MRASGREALLPFFTPLIWRDWCTNPRSTAPEADALTNMLLGPVQLPVHNFEPFLILPEANWYKGLKLSFHIPGLDAPFLYKLLLSHLGAGEKSSPQETEVMIRN